MKKIVPLLLCLLFGFSQYSWPQSGGGFPSSPKFTSVGVGARALPGGGLIVNNAATTPPTAATIGTGVYLQGGGIVARILTVNNNAAANSAIFDHYVDSGGCEHFRAVNDANNSTADWLQQCRSALVIGTLTLSAATIAVPNATSVTFPSATTFTVNGQSVCQANGTNCPSGAIKTAFANTLTSNTACPLSTTPQSSGISGCARNSVGSYTFTFTAGFTTNAPVCMASFQAAAAAAAGFPTNPPVLELGTSTTTNVTVLVATYTAIGTATLLDGLPISLLCHGT
jgi:hypothetical protein